MGVFKDLQKDKSYTVKYVLYVITQLLKTDLYDNEKKKQNRDWRDGPGVKSTHYSYWGPTFDYQYQNGGTVTTPIPGNPILSSHLLGHQAHTCYTDMHRSKTFIHMNWSK